MDVEGRLRFTRYTVKRDPNGVVIQKSNPYRGLRAPNGFIWAHFVNEFVYIPRVPSVRNYVTTWSRSMVKALGENYDEIEGLWHTPLVPPRLIRPWPVLKLPPGHPAQPDPPLGAIDEGCKWEHSDFMCYSIRADSSDDPDCDPAKSLSVYTRLVPRRCPSDPSEECSGRVVFNEDADSANDGQDMRYDFLWCKHFKSRLDAEDIEDSHRSIARAITELTVKGVIADGNGGQIINKPQFTTDDGQPSTLTIDKSLYKIRVRTSSCISTPESGISTSSSPFQSPRLDPDTLGELLASADAAVAQEEGTATTQDTMSIEDLDLNADASSSTDQTATSKEALPEIDPFSIDGLPKLEEFLPDGFLPDILLVHDPDRATRHRQAASEPVKYKRVTYQLPNAANIDVTEAKTEAHVAHLHLRETNRLGTGHHSKVYSAPFTLPPPLSAHSRTGQVTVAAKLAFPHCTAHTLLHNEARTYAQFPKHLQEEYCGFNVVPPCRFPVPVGPVVPKCFGFYLPVGEDGNVIWREEEGAKHSECSESRPCKVKWLSPILLMEQCGEPVLPEMFTVDQRYVHAPARRVSRSVLLTVHLTRTEVFSLVLRLHDLHITQGSFYVRNIMIQPGPLSFPRAHRSFKRPSFRIIDFGRARCLDLLLAGKEESRRGGYITDLQRALWDEEKQARDELLIEDCGF